MDTLKFHRSDGAYFARDATKEYAIWRDGKGWALRIRELATTAGVQHAIGQPDVEFDHHDLRKLAVATAQAYSDLGDDYWQHQHEQHHLSRLTRATQIAYNAEIDRLDQEA